MILCSAFYVIDRFWLPQRERFAHDCNRLIRKSQYLMGLEQLKFAEKNAVENRESIFSHLIVLWLFFNVFSPTDADL